MAPVSAVARVCGSVRSGLEAVRSRGRRWLACGSGVRLAAIDQLEPRALLSAGYTPIAWQASTVAPLGFGQVQPEPTLVVLTADLNADGADELLQASITPATATSAAFVSRLVIAARNASGVYQERQAIDFGAGLPFSSQFFVIDFDADGDADIVARERVLRNDAGTLSLTSDTPGTSLQPRHIADLDADGRDDLIIIDAGSASALFRDAGNSWTSVALGSATDALPTDANGDALRDVLLLTQSFSEGAAGVRLATLPRQFATLTPVQTFTNIRTLVAGDWSGDGALDLAYLDLPADSLRTLRFDRVTQRFTPTGATNIPLYPTSLQFFPEPTLRAASDLDGDGRTDFVVASPNPAGAGLGFSRTDAYAMLSRGDGQFAAHFVTSIASGFTNTTSFSQRLLDGPIIQGKSSLLREALTRTPGSFVSFSYTLSTPSVQGGIVRNSSQPVDIALDQIDHVVQLSGIVSLDAGPVRSLRVYADVNADGIWTSNDPLVDVTTQLAADTTGQLTFNFSSSNRYGFTRADNRYGTHRFFVAACTDLGQQEPLIIDVKHYARVFYPEGWRTLASVHEHIPLVNFSDQPADYRIVLRYANGERDQLVASGTLAPNARGGFSTALRGDVNASTARFDEAYAIEVQSSTIIGATLVRYDTFGLPSGGGAQGEVMTAATSPVWTFAGMSRSSLDFLLFYNPFPASVSIAAHFFNADGSSVERSLTLDGFRRGGLAVFDVPGLQDGTIGVLVRASGAIVAASSSHEPALGRSSTSLGAPDDLTKVLGPIALDGQATSAQLLIFNPETTPRTFTIERSFDVGAPLSASITVQPGQHALVQLRSGAPANAAAATVIVRPQSPGAFGLSAVATDAQRRDKLESSPVHVASTSWMFSEGYLRRSGLGVNSFESILLYNPHQNAQTVTLTFAFPDATSASHQVFLAPGTTSRVRLESLSVLTSRPNLDWFATRVTALEGVVATMTHWDLLQPGGLSTSGLADGRWSAL